MKILNLCFKKIADNGFIKLERRVNDTDTRTNSPFNSIHIGTVESVNSLHQSKKSIARTIHKNN